MPGRMVNWKRQEISAEVFVVEESGFRLEVTRVGKRFYPIIEDNQTFYYPFNVFFESLDGCYHWFKAGLIDRKR